jgi:hypothetical protein
MTIEKKESPPHINLGNTFTFLNPFIKNDPHWVPPIYSDEFYFHNPKRNSALQYSEVIRLMAYRSSQAVGRVTGIINKKYNEHHGEMVARFFQLDCINEAGVAHVLINEIEKWTRQRDQNNRAVRVFR